MATSCRRDKLQMGLNASKTETPRFQKDAGLSGMWDIRLRSTLRSAALMAAMMASVAGCLDVGDQYGQPADDCISANNPEGGYLCGLNAWDRDGDTISDNTENNPTNRVGNVPIEGFYTFSTVRWDTNYSEARGLASTTGSLFKGMNLRDQGDGYWHDPGPCEFTDEDDWGTGHLVRLVEGAGRYWVGLRDGATNMRVNDLSQRGGGFFGSGCRPDHTYHRMGLDVDVRYIRTDGLEIPLNICDEAAYYDAPQTAVLISSFLTAEYWQHENVVIDSIFVDLTCLGLPDTDTNGRRILFHKPGHQDHFHVMIRDPDGPYN